MAAAIGEADTDAEGRVAAHVARCEPCRVEHRSYRAIDRELGAIREAPVDAQGVARSRERLDARLDDLRSRIVAYRVFDSAAGADPPGALGAGRRPAGVPARPARSRGVASRADARDRGGRGRRRGPRDSTGTSGRTSRGGRSELPWALDLRLARSPFQRKVLERTASIPYGAVVSYKRLASDLGQPRAVRAVAQALRWNPIPIAIPCHRVVGAIGPPDGLRGRRDRPEAAAAHDRGRAAGAGARRLRGGAGRDVHARARGQRVLPPELRVDGDAPVRAPDVLRLPEPGRGGRDSTPARRCRPDLHPLHEVN